MIVDVSDATRGNAWSLVKRRIDEWYGKAFHRLLGTSYATVAIERNKKAIHDRPRGLQRFHSLTDSKHFKRENGKSAQRGTIDRQKELERARSHGCATIYRRVRARSKNQDPRPNGGALIKIERRSGPARTSEIRLRRGREVTRWPMNANNEQQRLVCRRGDPSFATAPRTLKIEEQGQWTDNLLLGVCNVDDEVARHSSLFPPRGETEDGNKGKIVNAITEQFSELMDW